MARPLRPLPVPRIQSAVGQGRSEYSIIHSKQRLGSPRPVIGHHASRRRGCRDDGQLPQPQPGPEGLQGEPASMLKALTTT